MKVRLIRKFAEEIDGIDLSAHRVSDVLDLPRRDAQMLLAEGWAELDARASQRPPPRAEADDTHPRRTRKT